MADRTPPIPTRAPEYVGPADEKGRREDVSNYGLRPLVVRTLDEVLHMQIALGSVMRELGTLSRKVNSDPPPSTRGPDDTLTNYVPKFAKLRTELRQAITDPSVRLDVPYGERIVEEALEKIQARRELGTWRWVKGLPKKLATGMVKQIPHWLFAGGLTELVHWLLAHK